MQQPMSVCYVEQKASGMYLALPVTVNGTPEGSVDLLGQLA